MMIEIVYVVAGLVGGYLLGSVPFGLVFTKMAGLGDIRDIGSKSIGATNVLRTGRKGLAFATLVCDSGKGAFAVFLLGMVSPFCAMGAALGSVLGHLYPVWLNFKGGKGVATAFGVLLVLMPAVGIFCAGVWLACALIFRISSLSALVAALFAPLFAGLLYGGAYPFLTLIIAVLVFVKHKDNIKRIVSGVEPRIGRS